MKWNRFILIGVCCLAVSGAAFAAQKPSRNKKKSVTAASNSTATKGSSEVPPSNDPALESVLKQMDGGAANFRTSEADFAWDQYQKVVDETDTQKGKIYFRRNNKETQTAAEITSPEKKYVLYSDGRVRFYQPKIDQVTEHDAGKNRDEVESFLALGFGGRGHDLARQYEIKLLGNEDVNGMKATKLELTPKSAKVRNVFNKIILWVDPERDISLKQQFLEPSGDYRTTTFMNVKLNNKISDDVFKLHTTGHTKVVRPQ